MSDRDTVIQDEIELITDFLNRRLDSARAEEVYRRMERDPEFLELATPLLFAWSVTPKWERPIPPGEAERHWAEFTKRADFVHHRKRRIARRNWMIGILVAAIGLPAFWFRDEIREQYREVREYRTVADMGWVSLRSNISARLERGTRLRSAKGVENNVQNARLQGTARFQVQPLDTAGPELKTGPLMVQTPGGWVLAHLGEFTVSATEDTTIVEAHAPTRRRYMGFMPLEAIVFVGTDEHNRPIPVLEGRRVRVVRGAQPEPIP